MQKQHAKIAQNPDNQRVQNFPGDKTAEHMVGPACHIHQPLRRIGRKQRHSQLLCLRQEQIPLQQNIDGDNQADLQVEQRPKHHNTRTDSSDHQRLNLGRQFFPQPYCELTVDLGHNLVNITF